MTCEDTLGYCGIALYTTYRVFILTQTLQLGIMTRTMQDKITSKKLLPIIIVVLVVLAGTIALVWSGKQDGKDSKQTTLTTTQDKKESTQPSTTVTYDGVEGKTALELLKTKETVVTKDSQYGPYVDSVNGVVGGTDGKYWAFYVNGQMAQVGADAYVTKTGDKIEWKFE